MPDPSEDEDPAGIAVLDETYLQRWEDSLGEEIMPSFIAELLNEFNSSYADKLAEARQHAQPGSEEELACVVHFLKGSLGNLGLARASYYARQAEFELRNDTFTRFTVFADTLDAHVQEGLRELKERY
ncbi:Hpt domain-containing protein [Cerasicoccus fimbriatus]|uniref:Hpt domain-containing protein n=1 Tax=Cerasicoccus fimbriatus TaxID=3014554 RepID=UPI0022B3C9E3|nr:Hpt domain-containing protein [Cerasicoccus sp. TK19100]